MCNVCWCTVSIRIHPRTGIWQSCQIALLCRQVGFGEGNLFCGCQSTMEFGKISMQLWPLQMLYVSFRWPCNFQEINAFVGGCTLDPDLTEKHEKRRSHFCRVGIGQTWRARRKRMHNTVHQPSSNKIYRLPQNNSAHITQRRRENLLLFASLTWITRSLLRLAPERGTDLLKTEKSTGLVWLDFFNKIRWKLDPLESAFGVSSLRRFSAP